MWCSLDEIRAASKLSDKRRRTKATRAKAILTDGESYGYRYSRGRIGSRVEPNKACSGLRLFQFFAHVMSSNRLVAARLVSCWEAAYLGDENRKAPRISPGGLFSKNIEYYKYIQR
jgi:hypothetical protein